MKVVVIIQARLGSTRLPSKVLLDLAGEAMLSRVVRRVRRAKCADEVIIATTTESRDDKLVEFCAQQGWPCYRGSENDVLDRYYGAAKAHQADIVVRITSDCPLIDPEVIDGVVDGLELQDAEYCSNTVRRDYPRGLDAEAFTFAVLEKAWTEDRDPTLREHVTQYIVRHPELFEISQLRFDENWSHLRWTVDTPEDFELVQKIYAHFGHDEFAWTDVLPVLAAHPDWEKINQGIEQKAV